MIKSGMLHAVIVRSFLVLLFTGSQCFAQEITIGVPSQDAPINFFRSEDPFAQIVLNASTQPLARIDEKTKSRIKLALADSFSSSADGNAVEFRLRSAAAFTNGQLINETDLQSSFKRCAQVLESGAIKSGVLNSGAIGSDYISKYGEVPAFTFKSRDQRIYVSIQSWAGQAAIFAFVENCPILEERSLRIFGDDLGTANLILSSGPYILVSRTKNREARLERAARNSAWAAVITVRGFAEALNGLTALQSGTIDALYTNDPESLEAGAKDPTLLIVPCGVYNVILRRGLEFSCGPQVDPGAIRYSEL